MKIITAYQCNFCRRVSRTIAGIKIHEEKCNWNPKKHHCFTCSNYDHKHAVCEHFGLTIDQKPYFVECEIYDVSEVIYGKYMRVSTEPVPYTCHFYNENTKVES